MQSNPAMAGNFEVPDAGLRDFFVDIDCNIRCLGQTAQNTSLRGVYSPAQRGLKVGNGNMLGRLGSDLESFGNQICVGMALKNCRTLQNIHTVVLQGMKSGKWELNEELACIPKKIIFSPYEPSVSAEFVPSSPLSRATPDYQSKLSYFDIRERVENYKGASTSCGHKVLARMCFGDCLMEGKDDEWPQTLAHEPLGKRSEEICVDNLAAYIQKEKISSETLKSILCKEYFWAAKVSGGGGQRSYLACAAARVEIDCQL